MPQLNNTLIFRMPVLLMLFFSLSINAFSWEHSLEQPDTASNDTLTDLEKLRQNFKSLEYSHKQLQEEFYKSKDSSANIGKFVMNKSTHIYDAADKIKDSSINIELMILDISEGVIKEMLIVTDKGERFYTDEHVSLNYYQIDRSAK